MKQGFACALVWPVLIDTNPLIALEIHFRGCFSTWKSTFLNCYITSLKPCCGWLWPP